MGTALVLKLISHRRQLEALDAAGNDLLRTIAMNRLLRTVATIAAGLGAVAGNFAARPDPAGSVTGWTNPAGIAGLVVLLALWVWAPPRLANGRTAGRTGATTEAPAGAHPATRLTVSLGAAMGLAPVVVIALALVVPGFLMPGSAFPGQAAVLVALIATAVLLVAGAGELLLHRNHGTGRIPKAWPRQVVSPAVLTTAILAVALLTAITVLTAAGADKLRAAGVLGPDRMAVASSAWLTAAAATVAVGLIAILPVAAARQRHSISTDIAGLDAALRAITIHRVVRTFAAYCTAQAGVLLMTASMAWPPLLGTPALAGNAAWQPAVVAGALLAAGGVVIGVIPVRGFARTSPIPATAVREAAQ